MKLHRFLTLLAFALSSSFLAAQEATIARLAGAETVTVTLPSGEEAMMGQGDVIPVGSWVEVPSGKLFLRTFTGTVSVFSAGAIFEVTEIEASAGKEKTRLTLQSGDMVANLDPNKRDVNDYGVVTPKGVAAARGTNYTVSVNGQSVLVTVVAGVVQVNIPDVGLVNLNTGQVTTGGQATSLSAALGDGATAAITRNALQAAAAAVASLSESGTDGVSTNTLDTVMQTISTAATEANDDTLVAGAAAAAVAAAPSSATTIVRSAAKAAPNSAASIVAAAEQTLENVQEEGAPTQDLLGAANEGITESNNEASGDTPTVETIEASDVEEAPAEVEVPNDNVTVIESATFTIRLSGGRLVAVTVNNSNDDVIVANTPVVIGAATAEQGDGSEVTFIVPPSVIDEVGNLSAAQRANIQSGIESVLNNVPGLEVEVPGNSIIISPSS